MGRPQETFSKVAAVFGVTRQAVYKWQRNGASFHSADTLLTWLNNRDRLGVPDTFDHRCPVLRGELERALAWPSYWP
jgi:transcriptional regulator with XRE-family HTH domain